MPEDFPYYDLVQQKWVKLRDKFSDSNYEFSTAHIFVHSKDQDGDIFNGIMEVEDVITTLPIGVYQGFYSQGTVYNNIYVCDTNGVLLYSIVKLVNQDGKVNFEIRDKKRWFNEFTNNLQLDNSEIYVAIGITSGSQFSCFLQSTEVTLSKGDIFPKYFPDLSFKTSKKSSLEIEIPDPQFLVGPYAEDVYDRIEGFNDVVSQISNTYKLYGTLDPSGAKHSLKLGYLYIPDLFLQLDRESRILPDGTKRVYSKGYLKEVLAGLNPSLDELKQISWFFVEQDHLTPNSLELKDFYKTFLSCLQRNWDNPLFSEFKQKLSGKTLSSQDGFTDSDLKVFEDLNKALHRIFGYEAFTLLKLGFLSLNQKGSDFSVEFITYNFQRVVEIMNKFKFKPLIAKTPNSGYNNRYFNDPLNRLPLLLSVFLSGHQNVLKRVDASGKHIPNDVVRIYTYSGSYFTDDLFGNFIHGIDAPSYHTSIYKQFFNRFYSEFNSEHRIGKRIAVAKLEIWKLLVEIIDIQINERLIEQWGNGVVVKGNVLTVPQFSSVPDRKVWLELMRRYYKITFAEALFFPQSSNDPTQLFFDLVNGKTGVSVSLGGGGLNHLVKNQKLILDVLKAKLTDGKVRNIYPALFFTYNHLVHTQQKEQKTNVELYEALTTHSLWGVVEKSIEKTAKNLYDMFTSAEVKSKDKITIQFRRIFRNGIINDKDGKIVNAIYNAQGSRTEFNKLQEIQKHNIIINDIYDLDDEQLYQKIYSIIYYMVKYQAFIIAIDGKAGSKEVIFTGTLSRLFDINYIKSLTATGGFEGLVWSDAAIANLDSWEKSWNKDGSWNDVNEYIPFYLLPDWKSNPLKELFRVKFGVSVEDLV